MYDNRNLLRVVIPPLANGDQSAISSGKVDSLCYNYIYDERNRLIEKRIPGSGWEYLMYDFRDRLVLSQDARLRDENAYKYYYILYDTLSRTVEEGECTEIQNYSLLRNTVKSSNNYIPATRDPFHKLYYDNETVTGTWSMPYSAVYTGIDRATLIRGLLAGEEVRVLETASWLKTVNYYDKYNRLIQTIRTLYDDATGKETLSTKYDFAGKIVQTRQVQVFGINPAVTVNKTFIYDHAGRLLKTEQQIVGDTPNGNVTLAENTYNELGQLITKNLHKVSSGVYLQGLDYSYNIRGWLKSINNPDAPGTDLFALRLLYEDAGSLASLTKENQFNGNISGFIWNRKSYPSGTYTKSAYSFIYDKVDRLNNSYYGEGSSLIASDKYREYDYTYDLNGNIKTLKRNNSSGTVMDNLAYTPENPQGSNRLMKITDSALPVEGFKDVVNTSDYAYDDNGNLIKDLNKGFTGITYNDLNLPLVLIRDANNRITYVYDAAGRKLRQVKKVNGIDTTRHYAGNFEYDNSKNLSLIRMEEGMVTKANGVYSYEYHLRDHLSNTRIVFKPGTGGIVTLLETTDYYPFGMSFSPRQSASVNQYLFSGKELQNEMALDWYDYGARFYDPQIGRFTGLDPIAESFYYVTPYNYAENSPIANIDLWGLQAVSYLAKLEYKRMTSLGNAVHNVSAFLTNSIGVNTYNSAAAAINYVADKADVASNFGAAAAVTGVMDDVNQTVDNFTTPISGAGVVEGLTNVENWEGAATAVFGAYLGSKTFSSETSSSTTLNKGVQSVDNASSNKSIYAPKDNNGNLITTQKTKAGNTKIDSEARVTAHTQLRTDKTGNYPQRTTFDSQGRKRADTHFSNHNETGKTNPHKHTYFKDGRRQENNQ